MQGDPVLSISTEPDTVSVHVVTTPPWAEQSDAEYFFHLDVPVTGTLPVVHIKVNWPDVQIQAAVCGKHIIPVQYDTPGTGRFSVDLNSFTGRVGTMNTTPYLSEPGLKMSIEQHAFVRRAGGYAQGPWPKTEIDATNQYMFAAREVIRALGLPQRLHGDGAGHMTISGFETNNPPHPDAPPHWHIIMSWPKWYGGQAPHLYVDDQGRHVSNRVTIDGLRASHTYGPGQWTYLRTPTGDDACALMITDTGGLAITAPNEPIYVLTYDKRAHRCVVSEEGVGEVGAAHVVCHALKGRIDVHWRLEPSVASTNKFSPSYDQLITFDPLTGSVISQHTEESPALGGESLLGN